MDKSYLELPERIKKSFPDIDSDCVVDLRNTNTEYAELFQKLAVIKQQHPYIDKILEGDGEIALTAEEHAVFVDCMRLSRKLDDLERLHLYFRGHTDALAYLKEIKAI